MIEPRPSFTGGYVKLPNNNPIVSMQTMSKEKWPKWMFWKPRHYYLYVATKNEIFEIDSHTVTLTDRAKSKIRYFSISTKRKS